MTRNLFFLAAACLGLTVVGVIIGLGQQPFGFIAALMCSLPMFMFFLGGGVFTLFARYQLVPKDEPTVKIAAKRRNPSVEALN